MSDTHASALAHQFDTIEQQREAASLGMWVFLLTEILFFGGMFLAYLVYRLQYPGIFARGSSHLDIVLGGINTAVLIASSLTMALAVYGSQTGKKKMLVSCLLLTMALGLAFLGIKAVEYHHKYVDGLIPGIAFFHPDFQMSGGRLFFGIYFALTGMHALHMVIGFGIMLVILIMALRDRFSPEYHTPVEVSGLYWHFVDIVWIFLFPLLYLLGRHLDH